MNTYSYYNIEIAKMISLPAKSFISSMRDVMENNLNPIHDTLLGHKSRVMFEILERIMKNYEKPEFDIKDTIINGKRYYCIEEKILEMPFCNLLKFNKVDYNEDLRQEKLLIIAPMAGHHATLLRNTVETFLPNFNVYITDWISASNVNISEGKFDMDDYVSYIIKFLKHLGEGVNIMAICQPVVPTLAAVSIMHQNKDDCIPKSMILAGGPIDSRINPTEVNKFATDRNLEWFEKNLISIVPNNHNGALRKVYPGFLQLTGFIAMNWKLHFKSQVDLYKNLLIEDDIKAQAQKKFYDEYFSVMDITAEFYLQTIKKVFLDFDLAKGNLKINDIKINPASINKTRLMVVEGERDDIAAVGQTKAAMDLCKNLSSDKKLYHMQENVGHYGIFSGSRFRNFIAPRIKDFIKAKTC